MSEPCARRARWVPVVIAGMMLMGAGLAQTRSTLPARLSQQDFVVEVRQVQGDGNQATTWSSSVGSDTSLMAQSVRVRQGEKAALRWETAQPLQWTQSLQLQALPMNAASANAVLGGTTQTLVWMESGQNWSITPRWRGGKHPVQLEVEIAARKLDDRTTGELPATQRQQLATTVSAPLDEWVTLAATGQPSVPGTYRSDPQRSVRTLLQVRVHLP